MVFTSDANSPVELLPTTLRSDVRLQQIEEATQNTHGRDLEQEEGEKRSGPGAQHVREDHSERSVPN